MAAPDCAKAAGGSRAERIASLIEALDAPDRAVVREAVDGLVALAGESRRQDVREALESRLAVAATWPVAYTLAHLVTPGGECLELLLRGLGNADQDVRWATERLLTRLGQSSKNVAACLLRLLRVGSPVQRRMAVYCLRDIGPDCGKVRSGILDAMRDPVALVRIAVVTTLIKHPETGRMVLGSIRDLACSDPDPQVRNAASFALKRLQTF